jgi:nucleotide-binding universal stress UspA family protein
VETRLSQGDAPDQILRTAGEVGADLIVMGTHGRTGLGRLLMGNVAESVLPEANCPVLVVKTPERVSPPTSDRPAAQAVTVS